jgi:hypothetical protein
LPWLDPACADLIRELHSEAPKFITTRLVVGFQRSSVHINADDPEGLTKLNQAIGEGGEPIGLIGVKIEAGSVRLYSRSLEEYRGEEWAEDFLHRVVQEQARSIGLRSSPVDEGRPNAARRETDFFFFFVLSFF